ncbi:hypothetical protein [Micromonospora zhanjiangensis]|uniref:Uncharacterized protein n=1 Tax=Micromonospora zhanjiangensis TaxID=1522057 RepID=A0ABV8KQC4_9ACTN
MHQQPIRPGLKALMAVGNDLLSSGWDIDRDDRTASTVVRSMIHPSGREITITTDRDGAVGDVTLTGLSPEQVAGAVTGAGLTGPAEDRPEPTPATPRLNALVAAELHRIADAIVRSALPLGQPQLRLGVLDSRADLERWARHFGVEIKEDGGTSRDIPKVDHEIPLTDERHGPTLFFHAQIQPDRLFEVERLRARVAELEAQQQPAMAMSPRADGEA